MSFHVSWVNPAESVLINLWLNSPNRQQMTDAVNRIDKMLQQNPTQAGESRNGDRRILFEYPLGVIYKVYPKERRVRVLHVWQYSKKTP